MTLEEKLSSYLGEHGLWPNEVKEIILAVKSRPENNSIRWGEPDGYPQTIFVFLTMSATEEAVRWIDANAPKHWARKMLANEVARVD